MASEPWLLTETAGRDPSDPVYPISSDIAAGKIYVGPLTIDRVEELAAVATLPKTDAFRHAAANFLGSINRLDSAKGCKESTAYCMPLSELQACFGSGFNKRLAGLARSILYQGRDSEIYQRYAGYFGIETTMGNRPVFKYHRGRLLGVHRRYDEIAQAVSDRQYGLPHLMLAKDMSISEVKEWLGKGRWKRFLAKPEYVAKAIADHVHEMGGSSLGRDLDELLRIKHSLVTNSLVHDVTLSRMELERCGGANRPGPLDWLNTNCRVSNVSDLIKASRRLYDTQMLADRLGEDINYRWSARRMAEYHDEASKRVASKQYSSEVFGSIAEYQQHGELLTDASVDRYHFSLITSPAELAVEGLSHRNCLAAYIADVEVGRCLIYRLEDTVTGEIANASIERRTAQEVEWRIGQVEAPMASAPNVSLVTLAEEIARDVNALNLPAPELLESTQRKQRLLDIYNESLPF